MAEIYITVPCQNCGKGIEFDRSQLGLAQTRTVICPHCEQDTIIFDKEARAKANKIERTEKPKKKRGVFLLGMGCIVIFLTGAFMVFLGLVSSPDNVFQQAVDRIQTGNGLLLMALSVILAALIRLVEGE